MVWRKDGILILRRTRGTSAGGSRGASSQWISAGQSVHRQGGERGRGVRPLRACTLLGMPDSFKGSVYGCGQLLPASSQFLRHLPKSDHAFYYLIIGNAQSNAATIFNPPIASLPHPYATSSSFCPPFSEDPRSQARAAPPHPQGSLSWCPPGLSHRPLLRPSCCPGPQTMASLGRQGPAASSSPSRGRTPVPNGHRLAHVPGPATPTLTDWVKGRWSLT